MAFDSNDDRIVYKTIEEITTPVTGRKVLAGYWWCYVGGKGVMFWRRSSKSRYINPQANCKEFVTATLCKKLYPWAEVKYIEVAYLKVDGDGAYVY